MSDRKLGIALVATGAAGLVAALIVGLAGWWLVGGAADTMRRTVGVAGEGVATAADTVALAGDVVERIDDGLLAVESGLEGAGGAFTELAPVLDELTRLAGEDVPAGIEAVDATAAALARVAAGLDTALGALSLFGVEFDDADNLAASLDEIDDSLEGVPERLRSQSDRLDRAASQLDRVGAQVETLAGEVAATREGLTGAPSLVGRYEDAAAEAAALVADADADLGIQSTVARALVVTLAAVLAMLQVVPLTLGARLLRPREAEAVAEVVAIREPANV